MGGGQGTKLEAGATRLQEAQKHKKRKTASWGPIYWVEAKVQVKERLTKFGEENRRKGTDTQMCRVPFPPVFLNSGTGTELA